MPDVATSTTELFAFSIANGAAIGANGAVPQANGETMHEVVAITDGESTPKAILKSASAMSDHTGFHYNSGASKLEMNLASRLAATVTVGALLYLRTVDTWSVLSDPVSFENDQVLVETVTRIAVGWGTGALVSYPFMKVIF